MSVPDGANRVRRKEVDEKRQVNEILVVFVSGIC